MISPKLLVIAELKLNVCVPVLELEFDVFEIALPDTENVRFVAVDRVLLAIQV